MKKVSVKEISVVVAWSQILTITFLALYLSKVVDWSLIVVLAPALIPAVGLVYLVVVTVIAQLVAMYKEVKESEKVAEEARNKAKEYSKF